MSGVNIKYGGRVLANMDGTGSVTLKTAGQYCEADVFVNYKRNGANGKTFKVTIDGPYPSRMTVIENDEDIYAHINDPTLCANFLHLSTKTAKRVICGFHAASILADDIYGYAFLQNADGGIETRRSYISAKENSRTPGGIYIMDDGSVQIIGTSDYPLLSGDYIVSVSWQGKPDSGDYALQDKRVTPTKEQQIIIPDIGNYGLSGVIVEPIPEYYQDVSSVNVAAEEVLAGKTFVAADGSTKEGTMPNNGAINATIDGLTTKSFVIPKGFHDGTGKVSLSSDIEEALSEL